MLVCAILERHKTIILHISDLWFVSSGGGGDNIGFPFGFFLYFFHWWFFGFDWVGDGPTRRVYEFTVQPVVVPVGQQEMPDQERLIQRLFLGEREREKRKGKMKGEGEGRRKAKEMGEEEK